MKSKMQIRIVCAAMLLCGAAIVVRSAAAQDTPPPPMPERSQGAPQGPGGPGQGRGQMDPARRLQMMKERLGLSDAQVTQLKAIYEDERTKSEALRADQTADPQANRAKMGEIRKDSETRIAAILTPDQKSKWDEMRAQQQRRGPGGPPPAGAPQPPPQV